MGPQCRFSCVRSRFAADLHVNPLHHLLEKSTKYGDSTMFDAPTTKQSQSLTPTILEGDLASGRYNDNWTSAGTRDRKRAAIRKAKNVFTSIGGFMLEEDFPCTRGDVEFFASRYLQSDEDARRATIKNKKSAARWVEEYCTVLDVASGLRDAAAALRGQNDDWAELVAYLTGQRGFPVVYGNYKMLPITSLALRCRERGITIAQLSTSIVTEFFPTLLKHQQASVLKGLSRLQDLHGSSYLPVELLPDVDVTQLHNLATPPIRVVPPIHPDFAFLMDSYLKEASEGTVEDLFGTVKRKFATKELSKSRVKNLQASIRWLWHGMVVLQIANHKGPFDPQCLTDYELIIDLIETCANGGLGSIIDSQTRRSHTLNVILFLEWNSPGFRDQLPKSLLRNRDILSNSQKPDTHDKIKKRNACENFINDKKLQKAFYLMPRNFYDDAKPIIAHFHAHARNDGNGISRTQNRALEQGIMAAITAINTIYCSRLATINRLVISGENSNIEFPDDDRKDSLVLNIPGHIVKNGSFVSGLQLRPNGAVNPRNILRWFIDDVHPLVLKYKHRKDECRHPDLLFTGLHTDTLRRYWANHTASRQLDMTPHMCRHFSASLLLDNGASYRDVATLLGISETITMNNYGFISKGKKIQDMMNVQATIFRNLEI